MTVENQLNDQHARLLQDWWRRARESQHSHHNAGKISRRLSWLIEGPAVILPLALGGIALAFVGSTWSDGGKVVVAVVGVLASVFSIAHLYFRFHERAAAHVSLGARYGNVRRRIEMILTCGIPGANVAIEIEQVRRELDGLAMESPVVPTWIHMRTTRQLSSKPIPDLVGRLGNHGENEIDGINKGD